MQYKCHLCLFPCVEYSSSPAVFCLSHVLSVNVHIGRALRGPILYSHDEGVT
ncbi:hypothetical protein E2C01_095694 [Portunus trituberculatus]|uniref:Uncharacterized protein n=1 Tax=Portunus trituberculatus TaxID=210409 RepID=A0A5B7K0T7_PORTR|nr:hypothetical protein [Portunus trituberculatus]